MTKNAGFQKVVSITYEEIGLFPRSFSRVLDRFLKQIFSDVENLILQEYRFYRYLFLTTLKTIFILLFFPFVVNFLAKNYIIKPLTEFFWNTEQKEIFLNTYQQTKAFSEVHDFEEKLYFESLLTVSKPGVFPLQSFPEGVKPALMTEHQKPNRFQDSLPLSLNQEIFLPLGESKEILVGTYGSEASFKRDCIVPSVMANPLESSNKVSDLNPFTPAGFSIGPTTTGVKPHHTLGFFSYTPREFMNEKHGIPCSLIKELKAPKERLFFDLGEDHKNKNPENLNLAIQVSDGGVYKNYGILLEDLKQELPKSLSFSVSDLKEQKHSSAIEQRLQEKILELAVYYNNESIEAITNIFADTLSFLTLLYLVNSLEIQINITKSFLLEVFFGLEDSKKCLLILLITDLLVGYHSPDSWELFLESFFTHYGLATTQTVVLLLVATLPVLLDVLFKYLIFRHLNRSSPTTVATYQALIE